MLTVGLALFLYTAAANTQQPFALTHPPSVVAESGGITSPDHAPPHPLSPRVPLVERTPNTLLAAVLQAAKTALTHGR